MLISTAFSGFVCLFVWMFATSEASLVVFSILYGIFGGGYISLFPVVTADVVGLEKLPAALGILYAASIPGNLLGTPIAGALLGLSNGESYFLVKLFSGIISIVASFFLVYLRIMTDRRIFVRV
jgi:MFS family permease